MSMVPILNGPLKEFIDVASQRWVIPQPENDPCPGCTLVQKPPPSSLTTETDPDLPALVLAVGSIWADANPGATIESATLNIVWSVDNVVTDSMTYTFTLPKLDVGEIYLVPNLGDGRSLAGSSAKLTFQVEKADNTEISVLNPVVVKP